MPPTPRRSPPRDQPISVPCRLTGPQWMNMPNFKSRQRAMSSGLAWRYPFSSLFLRGLWFGRLVGSGVPAQPQDERKNGER